MGCTHTGGHYLHTAWLVYIWKPQLSGTSGVSWSGGNNFPDGWRLISLHKAFGKLNHYPNKNEYPWLCPADTAALRLCAKWCQATVCFVFLVLSVPDPSPPFLIPALPQCFCKGIPTSLRSLQPSTNNPVQAWTCKPSTLQPWYYYSLTPLGPPRPLLITRSMVLHTGCSLASSRKLAKQEDTFSSNEGTAS